MATTTNYGWTTPDDTALVKDGASAIRSLGSAIDTTVFNNAGAAIAKTIVDAKGDIIAATAADTVSRLAVGANNTVLTADSSTATGLKWATPSSGGMTLLSTTTLSGATVTISGISGSYTDLQLYIYGVTNATADGLFRIAPNGNTGITSNFCNNSGTWNSDVARYLQLSSNAANQNPIYTSSKNAFSVTIFNYAGTTDNKHFRVSAGYETNVKTPDAQGFMNSGLIITTSAITSLVFSNAGGNLSTGTVLLYGVK
jgi:hypothetical protein